MKLVNWEAGFVYIFIILLEWKLDNTCNKFKNTKPLYLIKLVND